MVTNQRRALQYEVWYRIDIGTLKFKMHVKSRHSFNEWGDEYYITGLSGHYLIPSLVTVNFANFDVHSFNYIHIVRTGNFELFPQ